MDKNIVDRVYLVARDMIASKGFTYTLRELANAADVPFSKVQRTWLNIENLYRETEKHLYKELSSYLGTNHENETIAPLMVKIWFSLQSVTNARRFLLQKILSENERVAANPIERRLLKACKVSTKDADTDPNVLAATLYLIAINSDPKSLSKICRDFNVACRPEELSVMYLNEINRMLRVGTISPIVPTA